MGAASTSDLISAVFTDAGVQVESSAKRHTKRGEQTRERLLQAATECFTEYGYVRTRVSDVVHRAGTAQGNFYRHFASLDEIFLAVLRPGLEDLVDASAKRSGHSADLDSLVEANAAYLHAYARNRHVIRLFREAAAANHSGGFKVVWLRLREVSVAQTRQWLERLRQAGEIDDVDDAHLELLAEILGSLTDQLAYVHIGLPSTTPRPREIDALALALGEAWFKLLSHSNA